jgi:MFS family permease
MDEATAFTRLERPSRMPWETSQERRWILATLSLSMLLSSLGTSIANVALPTLAEAFDASFPHVQWVVLAYLLAVTTMVVSVGRLGDLVGRRRLLVAGVLWFAFASALCALAPALSLLIAARLAQGLGAAIMMSLTMAYVADTVPKGEIGAAMGLLGTMSAVGTSLGPPLGGALIAGFGWPSLFFLSALLGVLTAVMAHRCLPADLSAARSTGLRFDHTGTLLLATTLALYALSMTVGRGTFGPVNAGLITAAVALGIVFKLHQTNAAAPLITVLMFRQSRLRAAFMMSALVTTVAMATLVVGPFYLSGVFALEPAAVGLVMSAGPIVAAFTGAPGGRMVDRLGPQRVTVFGLVAAAVGCSMLAMLPTNFGVAGYVMGVVVITAGYALFQAANNTAVMVNIQADQRGVVSGILTLSRNLGLITGASLMGAVFASASGTASILTAGPEAVAGGMRITFALAAALIIGALGIALADRQPVVTTRRG